MSVVPMANKKIGFIGDQSKLGKKISFQAK